MKNLHILTALALFMILSSCRKNEFVDFANLLDNIKDKSSAPYQINEAGTTILERFPPPERFKAINYKENSYGSYLQNLTLKKYGERVKYYNGEIKPINNIYLSVINMPISNQDLQQCADAVMRLKAEYLYHQKKYDEIHFNFLSDGKPRYFKTYAKGDYSYKKFMAYMNYVMAFANTASLKDELELININDIEVGDVFIQKGNPYGHAVTVVNVAKDASGEKQFMLAQSYMPAQETQILANPNLLELSPWYKAEGGQIKTPEWLFSSSDLHRFP